MSDTGDDAEQIDAQIDRARAVFSELTNSFGLIAERQQRLQKMTPLDRFIHDKLQDDRARAVIQGMIDEQVIQEYDTDEHTKALNRLISEYLDADSIWAFAHIAGRVLGRSIFDDPTSYTENLEAREYAYKRHKKDPKQADKALVRECWDDWQKRPDRYDGKAAFARDMLDKFESLKSQPVIEGWCRAWERSA